jgi:hypothetical protein
MSGIFVVIVAMVAIFFLLWRGRRKDEYTDLIRLRPLWVTKMNTEDLRKKLLPQHRYHGMFNPGICATEGGNFDVLLRVSSFCACSGAFKGSPPYSATVYRATMSPEGRLSELNIVPLPYDTLRQCTNSATGSQKNNGVEDPRIFVFKGERWGAANCNGVDKCIPKMCIWKLSDPSSTFKILNPPKEYTSRYRAEKNWSPFEHGGRLLFEYLVNPHIIFECNTETGDCTFVSKTKCPTDIPELWGNAPPIRINNDEYLGLCHRWLPTSVFMRSMGRLFGDGRPYSRNYLHYFYIFEASPPFKIKSITNAFKLGDADEKVQFACGMCRDDKDSIVVSYGENDCDAKIAAYKLKNILALMATV